MMNGMQGSQRLSVSISFAFLCAAPLAGIRRVLFGRSPILDIEAMREGAAHFIGQHDFTTFRSSICQAKSPVKNLDVLDIEQVETRWGPELHFHVRARSFLHNQVRSIVGTLERVGAGTWGPERVKEALEARERSACGPVSPPYGLYLAKVVYPDDPFA